jgi:hypothetical protein
MVAPRLKLAASLEKLHTIQKTGKAIVRSGDLTRTHLERLAGAGFLRPIVRGWYMSARPDEAPSDTTTWFASLRSFVRGYCDERFKDSWYVNAELSLKLLTGATTLPFQIQVHTQTGSDNHLALPAGTSLFDYRVRDGFAAPAYRAVAQGLRALTLEAALVRAAPNTWASEASTMRLALEQLRQVSDLNRLLLHGDHATIAGRLAGGLRAVGKTLLADEIVQTMHAAGHKVIETNPFVLPVAPVRQRPESPYCARIRAMWADMRPHVVRVWDVAERRRVSARKYLSEAQLRYVADAYHSLSIEGYQVSAELIERVRSGDWLSGSDEHGQHDRNTLAARGYHEAHLAVRKSLQDVLAGQSAGDTLRRDLSSWYRALWAPSVRAGLLAPQDLAGWRSQQVFIKNARHVPLPPDAVRDAMPLLFELLADEPLPAVRAVLGHFVFVFIHPYMDGNGRLARFIMNLMLSQGGWPWTVVSLDLRDDYMQALEAASSGQDIKPFARLISRLVQDQLVKPPQR